MALILLYIISYKNHQQCIEKSQLIVAILYAQDTVWDAKYSILFFHFAEFQFDIILFKSNQNTMRQLFLSIFWIIALWAGTVSYINIHHYIVLG